MIAVPSAVCDSHPSGETGTNTFTAISKICKNMGRGSSKVLVAIARTKKGRTEISIFGSTLKFSEVSIDFYREKSLEL